MIFQPEPPRREGAEITRAAFNLKDLAAGRAVEVVVVLLAGELVAGAFTGDFDGLHDAGFNEELEGAVNGGEAEAADAGLGVFEHLAWGKGRPGIPDGIADGLALTGLAFAAGHRYTVYGTLL